VIFLDFETRSAADLKRWGARRYALDTSTQALCLAWSFDQEEKVYLWHRAHPTWATPMPKSKRPDELIERIRSGEPVEAHNAGFEFNIWNECFTVEFPEFNVKLTLDQLYCSAAKASCLSLPRSLDDAVDALGLPDRKIADGRRLINKLSKPMVRRGKKRGDGIIEFCEEEHEHRANWEYCKQDVRAERGLSNFCPEMTSREREYWLMDMRMNLRGIALDIPAANAAFEYAGKEAKRLNEELSDLTEGVIQKGSQRQAFLRWANGRFAEVGGEPLINTKADTLSFVLDGVPTKAGDEAREANASGTREKWDALGPEAENIERSLRICMEVNRSSVAKYKTMRESVCSAKNVARQADDAIHDVLLYNGADRTGRWCLSPDAEVLTTAGWISFEKWSGGEIAQWSPSGAVEFAPATKVEFPYTGDMVRLVGPRSELLCTPDHLIPQVPIPYHVLRGRPPRSVRAGDFTECTQWMLPLAGVLTKKFSSPDITRAIVMFQADGTVYAGRYALGFSRERKITRCRDILRRLKISFSEYIDYSAYAKRTGRKPMTKFILHHPPQWLRDAKEFDAGLLAHDPSVFIDELKHWDGHAQRNGSRGTMYYTTSQTNAEWVRTMAHLAGRSSSLSVVTRKEHPNWLPSLCVFIRLLGNSALSRGWEINHEPFDGRVYCAETQTGYFLVRYRGTIQVTGNSGKGVQVHNFVRGYSKDMNEAWNDIMHLDHDLITMIWGEPMVMLAKACRGALIARPGKELYAADFNAIEARKLAWLSGCSRLLDLFTSGGDPYIDMASAIYKRPITKADKAERALGKVAILGLGYSMGYEKFQATVWGNEGIWLEDEFCQEIVRIYRKDMYPEIPQLWRASEKAAISAVLDPGGEYYCGGDEFGIGSVSYFMAGRFLHCRLPSGRLLAYLDPQVRQRVTYRFAAINERGKPTTVNFPAKKSVPQHRVRWHAEKLAEKQHKRLLPDPPESFVSPHLSFMGRDTYTKKWKRCGTHGGSLVENYDQASSRDLLAEAMFRVDEMPEFDLLLSIHDEVIAQAAIGSCTVKEFECIMSIVPVWCPGMPIAAEGWAGPRLRK